MTFFQDTGRTLQREWDRIRHFPILPTLMFVLPLISFLFFAVIFSIGVPRNIPIAVLDEDNTSLSRTLVNMVNATPSASIRYEITDMHEGEELIKKGKIKAVYHIPPHFEQDILSQTKTSVSAFISGLNVTDNGMLNKDLQTVTTTFTTGIQIQLLTAQGLSPEQAYVQSLPLYFDSHVLFNPYLNYGYYLLPSFLPMMLMVFTLLLTIFSIGNELKHSTSSHWITTAGGRIFPAIVGKLMPYTASMFIMGLLMNTIMYKWLEVPMNGNGWLLIIGTFMFVLAYQSIGILIIAVLANLRQALSIGGGYSVLAFTFSGLTFPLLAMDHYLRVIAYIFPFTVYTEIFVDQAVRGAPAIYTIEHFGWLSLYIILPLLCLPRLRQVATTPKFWGRT